MASYLVSISNSVPAVTASATRTSVHITGLNCGPNYSFKVQSVGADGQPVPASRLARMPACPLARPAG